MLTPNTLINNRYLIQKEIASGGQATVYLAHDQTVFNRPVALKLFSLNSVPLAEVSQAADQFRATSAILANLSHPRITQISDFFLVNNTPCLVTEWVEGETLETRLSRLPHGFGESQVIQFGIKLCDVLTYLHSRNPPVIFRDLKPGNVMVLNDNDIKLIDFGIARQFRAGQVGDTTPLGTPGYASPEQYGTGQTGPYSDVYTLGATMLQLVSGYDPASSPFALPRADAVKPKVSKTLSDILAKATHNDPKLRYQSTAELSNALSTQLLTLPSSGSLAPAAGTAPVAATISTSPQNPTLLLPTQAKPPQHTPKRTGAIAAAAGVIGAIGLGAILLTGRNTSTPAPAATAVPSATTSIVATVASTRSAATNVPNSPTPIVPTLTVAPTSTPRPTINPTPTPPTDAKTVVFGPKSDSFQFDKDNAVDLRDIPNLNIGNFDLEVGFINPAKQPFDYGVIFRRRAEGSYRFVITHEGKVSVVAGKQNDNDSTFTAIKPSNLTSQSVARIFNLKAGERNNVKLHTRGNELLAYVNNEYVGIWPLNELDWIDGRIAIATELLKMSEGVNDGVFDYRDLIIRSNAPAPVAAVAQPTAPPQIQSTAIPQATAAPRIQPTAVAQASASSILITLQNSGYNTWGRPARMDDPKASCSSTDDKRPVQKFDVSMQITNNSSEPLSDFWADFKKSNRSNALVCYYGYAQARDPIPPGQARNITFVGFVEPGERISSVYIFGKTGAVNTVSNQLGFR